ncbi:protein SSUH2 homolog [Babylonia areolata]|uniref:protein SSUH2 homolog n=1 Tax=Babylonia areolata TaxID=304850 RepID=UPI003FD1A1B6
MEFEPWHPGMGEEVPDEWKEGDGPPEVLEGEGEEEVPDPNMEGMPTIWGYEDCNFDKKKKERPPKDHHKADYEGQPVEVQGVPVPEEEVCRRVVTEHVNSDCCLGKDPINTMVIDSVTPSNAFTYTLETYVEKRKAGYEYKPYKGGDIDDPSRGRAPECWELKVSPKEFFKDQTEKEEVPHTSTVRTCHHCLGMGFVRCGSCRGWGSHVCPQCSGVISMETGEGTEGPMCSGCNDSHLSPCLRCGGEGRVLCPACDGYRAIRCFIQIKIKFKTYKEQFVKEDTALPDNLIKEVKGVTVFEQTNQKLCPLTEFSIAEIAAKSQQFFSKHQLELLDKKRLLQQRQKLVAVPVAEVAVTWKDQPGRFWVYGKENKLYLPDYPDTCACCVIL